MLKKQEKRMKTGNLSQIKNRKKKVSNIEFKKIRKFEEKNKTTSYLVG